jgi:hyaluronan synthase
LRALLKSDYPAEKMEIIAINDGSADDTWNWITLVAGEANGRITAINLEQNQGKKHALHLGFNQAKHEIAVTIDSDSFVQPDTLRNLVLPFKDPRVGGSAGVVRVRNMHQGFIPRILDICFVFSCDFIRSAQSAIGAVLCSPGAISAYRRAALLPHLDGWLHQTFLGKPSTIGEDRALTSILLRNDYRVVLQNNALVETCVPVNYPQLCRTLIRWTRGDVREGLLMIRHFYKRFNFGDWRLTALKINLVCQLLGLMLPVIMFPLMIFTLVHCAGNLLFMASYSLFFTWLWATIPAVLYAHRETPLKAAWAFVSALFSLLALSWICIYSWITMNNPGWMTRDISKKDEMETAVRGVHGN